MPGFGQITPTQAFGLIGAPDAATLFDVRTKEDVAALPRLVPTARRVAKLSEGAAAGLPMVPFATLPAPGTRFLCAATVEVTALADCFGATHHDIEGVTFSHRGEPCTFDALPDDFRLHSDALDRMATAIRAADTDRHGLSPQAAGLLALSVGLSRMCHEELQQLAAGLTLDDALYRRVRDGHEEGHDWPKAGKA
jgi:hypothetical protein